MKIGLHVVSFSWPDTPASIAPTLAGIASAAEEAGISHLSVMDHWFQMEAFAPATEPMLEGYTTLGFLAAHTSTTDARPARDRRDVPPSGPARQDGRHARRALRRSRRARYRRRVVRARASRASAFPFPPMSERFERLEETLQICFQMWSDDDGPFKGKHYELAETICVPPPISSAAPAGHDRWERRAQDAAARRALRRLVQPVRAPAR